MAIVERKVRYQHRVMKYEGFSEPTNLIVDKEYEVVDTKLQPMPGYILNGVDGVFYAGLFDEVIPEDQVYFVISSEEPVVGKPLPCYKAVLKNGRIWLELWVTGPMMKVERGNGNIYCVKTFNGVHYVVAVDKE